MYGSGYPSAQDAVGSYTTVTEGVTAFTANLPNEIAAALEAVQVMLGSNPSDLSSTGADIGGTDHTTVAALILARARWEIGSDTFTASAISKAVTFTTSRFSSAPKVFLMPQRSNSAAPSGDDAFSVGGTTTSGFTAYRNNTGGSPNTSAQTFKYLAIQWPD